MRKTFVVFMLAVSLAACGGGKAGALKAGASGSPTKGANNAYCNLAKSYQSSSEEISNAFKGVDFSKPEEAKKQLATVYRGLTPKFKQQFADALIAAPAELKADIQLFGTNFLQFLELLEKSGYDFMKIGQDPNFTKLFADPKFIAASDRVGKYGAEKCGIPYTPAPKAS